MMHTKVSSSAKWSILVAVVWFGVAMVTGTAFFYFTAWCWLILIVFSMVIHFFNVRSLSLQFEMDKTEVSAGDPVTIRYRILNSSVIPAYHVYIQPIISKAFGYSSFDTERYAFNSFEMKTIERKLVAKRRGYYTLGRVQMEAADPLELLKSQYEKQKAIEIIVRPNQYNVSQIKFSSKELMGWRGQMNKRIQDRTSVKHVREYREGDSLKDLHFKLSAKTGKLKTKEYAQSVSTTVLLLIDGEYRAYEKNPDLADEMMDVATSLAAELLKRQLPLRVIVSDHLRTNFSGKNYSDFKPILEHFTAFTPNGGQSFDDFLEKELKLYPAGASVITLSRSSEAATFRRFADLRRRGYESDHFVLLTHEEMLALSQEERFFCKQQHIRLGISAKKLLMESEGSL